MKTRGKNYCYCVIFQSSFLDSDRQIFVFQINLAFSVISTIDLTRLTKWVLWQTESDLRCLIKRNVVFRLESIHNNKKLSLSSRCTLMNVTYQ